MSMFNYSNQQQMMGGVTNPDFQRLADTFYNYFCSAIQEFQVPPHIANTLWANISDPQTIIQSFDRTITANGQYDMNRLYHDMKVYVQTSLSQMQPQARPAVFSNVPSQGCFPGGGMQGTPQSFGRQPQGPVMPAGAVGGGFVQQLASNTKTKPQPVAAPHQMTPVEQEPEKPKDRIFVVSKVAADVVSEPTDIAPISDDFLETKFITYLRFRDQEGAPTLMSHAEVKYPFATKLHCIRFLRENYPDLFAAERWIVAVDMPIVLAYEVEPHKAVAITQAFERTAEKMKVITDRNSLLSIIPNFLRTLGDDDYVSKVVIDRIRQYMQYYMRNPRNPILFPNVTSWVEIAEMFRKEIPEMEPWVKSNPEFEKVLTNVLLSALKSIFPEGKSPIMDAFSKENRGLVATIPNIHLKIGKYTLRDYGFMSKDQQAFCEQELKSRYLLRKISYRVFLTNIPENEVISDEHEITVIPYGGNVRHRVSLLHDACDRLTLGVDLAQDADHIYRLPEIFGTEDDDPASIDWKKCVGMDVQMNQIFF